MHRGRFGKESGLALVGEVVVDVERQVAQRLSEEAMVAHLWAMLGEAAIYGLALEGVDDVCTNGFRTP